jgi:hypothetical protein
MFRISGSSSLLDGCDDPEILCYENLKSIPWVLTSDNLLHDDLQFAMALGTVIRRAAFGPSPLRRAYSVVESVPVISRQSSFWSALNRP